MADLLPDEIVCNIFARLPAKALLRFRCLSKYWNRVVREPYFMNLRSRRIIIIPLLHTFRLIDDNVPIDDMPHSILERCLPNSENLPSYSSFVKLSIGTLNGIVLIAYPKMIILYNPFTGASKTLPRPPPGQIYSRGYAYGFGYGTNADDLKIVRFSNWTDICDVYSFKKRCWSSWSTSKYNITCIRLIGWVGKFLNGFLHWGTWRKNVLTVLNVKDMVLSELRLPFEVKYSRNPLGDVDGCLCTLQHTDITIFDMWVMKEYGVENSWLKLYSFTLPAFDDTLDRIYHPLVILDSGKILMRDPLEQLIIYDASKDSYKTLNISLEPVTYSNMHGLEYVESLVSPSDILFEEKEESI